MRSKSRGAAEPADTIALSRDHMVDHPSGAHYALWNGPAFLDIGRPAGDFVRFAVADLPERWTLLTDGEGRPLPVAARADRGGVAIWWLPDPDRPAPPSGASANAASGVDYAAALQRISATRYQGLMDAAWGIGGWSTHRRR
jgi:hypothetical protein